MRDKGLDRKLVHEFDASERSKRGWAKGFFGFRKMFWDYLNKLHIPFVDDCCDTAPSNSDVVPTGFNISTGEHVYWDSTTGDWFPVADWESTTTTTTTTSTSTTTTTTTTTP